MGAPEEEAKGCGILRRRRNDRNDLAMVSIRALRALADWILFLLSLPIFCLLIVYSRPLQISMIDWKDSKSRRIRLSASCDFRLVRAKIFETSDRNETYKSRGCQCQLTSLDLT